MICFMKKEKLSTFPWKLLLDWYEIHGRTHLPWREYSRIGNEKYTPESLPLSNQHPSTFIVPSSTLLYRVWLSEILLQQTQAERVIGFFEKMIRKYPTIQDLASSSYEAFFPYYQ